MKRLLTAAVLVPLVLWAVFRLPAGAFFASILVLVLLAGSEFAKIVRSLSPSAPMWLLGPLLALVAIAMAPWLGWAGSTGPPGVGGAFAVIATILTVGVGSIVALTRTPIEEGVTAIGGLAFGALYLGLPVAALADLQRRSPWLLFLLLAIVWLGDTAAFYVGTRFGRRKLAPVLSPNKSWEGAIASAAAGVGSALVWSLWRDGSVDAALLAVAAGVSVVAQMGDLVESMIKRAAGVKDSGSLLPGHGGLLDRVDAMLFAAPVYWLLLESAGRLPQAP